MISSGYLHKEGHSRFLREQSLESKSREWENRIKPLRSYLDEWPKGAVILLVILMIIAVMKG